MDKHFSDWLDTRLSEGGWMNNFGELKAVCTDLGRLPKGNEKMGLWLGRQRQKIHGKGKGKPLSDKQRKLMDKTFHGWLDTRYTEGGWMNNFEELKIIVSDLGSLPTQRENMGIWLNNQRRRVRAPENRKPLTDKQRKLLDDTFPKWLDTGKSEGGWMNNFEELKAVFADLGRLPKRDEKMGSWLTTQRQTAHGKGNRKILMDKHFPGWLDTRLSGGRWMDNFKELKVVFDNLGRFPKQKEHMGSWLNNQRSSVRGKGNRKPITDKRRKLMDKTFPDWLNTK